jgi:hypothetical protein
MAHASQRPAFGNGPLAQAVVAFLVGAFVIFAFWAYADFQAEYEAAPDDIKRDCANRMVGKYQHCVVREAAARRAAEQH